MYVPMAVYGTFFQICLVKKREWGGGGGLLGGKNLDSAIYIYIYIYINTVKTKFQ